MRCPNFNEFDKGGLNFALLVQAIRLAHILTKRPPVTHADHELWVAKFLKQLSTASSLNENRTDENPVHSLVYTAVNAWFAHQDGVTAHFDFSAVNGNVEDDEWQVYKELPEMSDIGDDRWWIAWPTTREMHTIVANIKSAYYPGHPWPTNETNTPTHIALAPQPRARVSTSSSAAGPSAPSVLATSTTLPDPAPAPAPSTSSRPKPRPKPRAPVTDVSKSEGSASGSKSTSTPQVAARPSHVFEDAVPPGEEVVVSETRRKRGRKDTNLDAEEVAPKTGKGKGVDRGEDQETQPPPKRTKRAPRRIPETIEESRARPPYPTMVDEGTRQRIAAENQKTRDAAAKAAARAAGSSTRPRGGAKSLETVEDSDELIEEIDRRSRAPSKSGSGAASKAQPSARVKKEPLSGDEFEDDGDSSDEDEDDIKNGHNEHTTNDRADDAAPLPPMRTLENTATRPVDEAVDGDVLGCELVFTRHAKSMSKPQKAMRREKFDDAGHPRVAPDDRVPVAQIHRRLKGGKNPGFKGPYEEDWTLNQYAVATLFTLTEGSCTGCKDHLPCQLMVGTTMQCIACKASGKGCSLMDNLDKTAENGDIQLAAAAANTLNRRPVAEGETPRHFTVVVPVDEKDRATVDKRKRTRVKAATKAVIPEDSTTATKAPTKAASGKAKKKSPSTEKTEAKAPPPAKASAPSRRTPAEPKSLVAAQTSAPGSSTLDATPRPTPRRKPSATPTHSAPAPASATATPSTNISSKQRRVDPATEGVPISQVLVPVAALESLGEYGSQLPSETEMDIGMDVDRADEADDMFDDFIEPNAYVEIDDTTPTVGGAEPDGAALASGAEIGGAAPDSVADVGGADVLATKDMVRVVTRSVSHPPQSSQEVMQGAKRRATSIPHIVSAGSVRLSSTLYLKPPVPPSAIEPHPTTPVDPATDIVTPAIHEPMNDMIEQAAIETTPGDLNDATADVVHTLRPDPSSDVAQHAATETLPTPLVNAEADVIPLSLPGPSSDVVMEDVVRNPTLSLDLVNSDIERDVEMIHVEDAAPAIGAEQMSKPVGSEDDGGHNVLRPAAPQVDDKSDVEMVKASEESSSIEHPVGLGSTDVPMPVAGEDTLVHSDANTAAASNEVNAHGAAPPPWEAALETCVSQLEARLIADAAAREAKLEARVTQFETQMSDSVSQLQHQLSRLTTGTEAFVQLMQSVTGQLGNFGTNNNA